MAANSSTSDGGAEDLCRVVFTLPAETAEWARASTERLWAEKTGESSEVRVRNIPFYVKSIAFGDTIRTRPGDLPGELAFAEFVAESGHSTLRVIIREDHARQPVIAALRSSDCTWEVDSTGLLWAVDVPPTVDYAPLRAALLHLRERGGLDLQEGALATAHRAQTT